MSENFNKAFKGVSKQELDKQEAEYFSPLRRLVGLEPKTGTPPPQEQPNLQPRDEFLSSNPSPKPYLGTPVDERIRASDLSNQLKQLQDLEEVGAFEDPDSEVNVRAKRLRDLLGK